MPESDSKFKIPDPHGRKKRFVSIGFKPEEMKDLHFAVNVPSPEGELFMGATKLNVTEYLILNEIFNRVIESDRKRREG